MKLTCYGTYTDGKEFWLPSKEMNALYCMNTSDRSVKYRGLFPECLNDRAWDIKRVIEYRDELFFFSIYAYQVWKLNRKTNEIKEITYCTHSVSQITNIEMVQDEVWVIPNSFRSPIIFFDLQEEKGHLFQWDSEAYWNYGTGSFTRTARAGDKLYFATRNKNDIHLCVLDCQQKTILFERLDTLSLIQCIGIKNDRLWVFGEDVQKRNVLQEYDRITLQKRVSHEMVLPEKLMETGGLSYFLMAVFDKNLLLIPAWAKEIILFDLETKQEKIIEYPEEFLLELKKTKGVIFNEIQKIDRTIYLMPHLIPQILILDTETMTFETWNVEVPEGECVKAFERCFCGAKGVQIYERDGFLVDDLCRILKRADTHAGDIVQNNVGTNIYRSFIK